MAKKAPPAPAKGKAKAAPAKKASSPLPINKDITPPKTKGDFIKQLVELSKKGGVDMTAKAADTVFSAVFDILVHAIRSGGRFSVPNFGTFNVRTRQAREGVNPRTKAKIKISASKVIRFKPTSRFKTSLG